MPDAHANFAASTVATAPSPATSGTSLVVASGDGAKFPAVPFNATVWAAGSQPTTTNAEIVRVTGIATDTLTITRHVEGTSARSIGTGDQIAATITNDVLRKAEQASSLRDQFLKPSAAKFESWPRTAGTGSSLGLTSGTLQLVAVALPADEVISSITFVQSAGVTTPTNWWFGLYDSSFNQLAVTADQLTGSWLGSTSKTLSIATVASGSASSFTTTYTGLYYVGCMVKASTPGSLIATPTIIAALTTLSPPLSGTSDTAQTSPPAFPHTASTPTGTQTQMPYAYVS